MLSQAACSTTYQPRPTGRVAMVIHHAGAFYSKDGREVPVGPLGGGLEDLTGDLPTAAAHARTAHARLVIGVPAYLAGAAGVIVGVVVLSGPIGWVVIGGGAAFLGTGLGFMGSGFTHAIDAVNIHNDAVEAPSASPRPQGAWEGPLRDPHGVARRRGRSSKAGPPCAWIGYAFVGEEPPCPRAPKAR